MGKTASDTNNRAPVISLIFINVIRHQRYQQQTALMTDAHRLYLPVIQGLIKSLQVINFTSLKAVLAVFVILKSQFSN